jgi:non-specific serine/threonine protein kinase
VTLWTPVAHRYLGLLALLRGEVDEAEAILRTSLLDGRDHAPQFDFLHWLEALAGVAAAQGNAARAATLWGATDGLFENIGLALLEENRQVRERYRDDARVSSDGGSWERGRAMTLQQAVDYAVTEEVPTASDLPHDLGRPS